MPAAAAEQALSSQLSRAKQSLNASYLENGSLMSECDKLCASVETNDAQIQRMNQEEAELKRHYEETKLAYDKARVVRQLREESLRQMRHQKVVCPHACVLL